MIEHSLWGCIAALEALSTSYLGWINTQYRNLYFLAYLCAYDKSIHSNCGYIDKLLPIPWYIAYPINHSNNKLKSSATY